MYTTAILYSSICNHCLGSIQYVGGL